MSDISTSIWGIVLLVLVQNIRKVSVLFCMLITVLRPGKSRRAGPHIQGLWDSLASATHLDKLRLSSEAILAL